MGSFSIPWPFGKRSSRGISTKNQKSSNQEEEEDDLEEFGVTQQLRDYVKGFTINTFKDYPLQDDEKGPQIDGPASNVSQDLTEWQERHAMLVLSKVKEISQLRYVLCPRHLKEGQFWRIYFLLVKTYVSPFPLADFLELRRAVAWAELPQYFSSDRYEIRALTKVRLRMLELQNEKSVNKAAIEVEMTDTKLGSGSSITLQHDSESLVDGI